MEAENLKGRKFGELTVLKRAEDHISKCGAKKVRWLCQCSCGNQTTVLAADLKRGSTKSCGCLQARKGKLMRYKKICVICGKEFECPPTNKVVTCSKECRSEYARVRSTGRKMPESAKKVLSEKHKGQNLDGIRDKAIEAIKKSPTMGRYVTNRNAMDWHLIAPDGTEYFFHSLNFWLRENCRELFDCEPDSKGFLSVRSGLTNAKRAMMGKIQTTKTYKGWKVLPTKDDIHPKK